MNEHTAEKDAAPYPAAHYPATSGGCYICRPDNPDADPEGCAGCEREWWAWYASRVIPPDVAR